MAANVEVMVNEDGWTKKRRRKLVITIILIAVGLHVLFAIGAGVWVIAQYFIPPPAVFEVQRDIRLPAKQREHKMNMAAFDAMTPKPTFNDKMQSMRPAPFALPDLPKMPMDQMMPLDPSAIISDQVSNIVGTSGQGGGGDGAGGLGGEGLGFSFMGIQTKGKRILLLFDVSTSVKTKADKSGVPLTKIREETQKLLRKLPITARFGLIQFTQNYKPFNRELLPATDPNREAALKWLEDEWVSGGTMSSSASNVTRNPDGLIGVLKLASEMQPDVIFLISDGSFQSGRETIDWKDIKEVVKGPLQGTEGTQLNFIGFEMKRQDKSEMGSIVRSTKGKLREIK